MFLEGTGVAQDYARAADLFEMAADQGDAYGQVQLGLLLAEGWGREKDLGLARSWLERSAKQGNTLARLNLVRFYLDGDGGPKNAAKAFDWALESAEAGVPEAQFALGLMYTKARGVRRDLKAAGELVQQSGESGTGGCTVQPWRDVRKRKRSSKEPGHSLRLVRSGIPSRRSGCETQQTGGHGAHEREPTGKRSGALA